MITREDCIKIGEITKTHNLQGNVIVAADNDLLEKYADEPVFLLLEGAPVPFFIAEDGLTVRNQSSYIVKFDHVDTLRQAEHLAGCDVMLEKALLEEEELEPAGYDDLDWEGFAVVEENTGETGQVVEVVNYSGNVVLTLRIFGKEILLPFSDHYVLRADFHNKQLFVQIPSDLIDLN